jgi:hypothetical protein
MPVGLAVDAVGGVYGETHKISLPSCFLWRYSRQSDACRNPALLDAYGATFNISPQNPKKQHFFPTKS